MEPRQQEELYNDRALRDAAARWREMDKLVRDLRDFKPGQTLKDDEKKLLLSFVERTDYLMPPQLNARRKYAYDEVVNNLTGGAGSQTNMVSQCERWCAQVGNFSDSIAPLPPQYDSKLLSKPSNPKYLRDVHATSTAIACFVHACDADIDNIERNFPNLYTALLPYRCATHLIDVKGAAIRLRQGRIDLKAYENAVDAFASDTRHQDLVEEDIQRRILNSKANETNRSLLEVFIPKIAIKYLLPGIKSGYRNYQKIITEAIAEDIGNQFSLGNPESKDDAFKGINGDSAKMVLCNPTSRWLEDVYEMRWSRVVREIAKQIKTHKTEFHAYRSEPQQAQLAQSANGQIALF
jgi:hypothetical protein